MYETNNDLQTRYAYLNQQKNQFSGKELEAIEEEIEHIYIKLVSRRVSYQH